MASKDPETRRRIAAMGGRARATAPPEELAAAGRAGADVLHSATTLARRLVKKWPDVSRAERATVRAILAEIAPRERPPRVTP